MDFDELMQAFEYPHIAWHTELPLDDVYERFYYSLSLGSLWDNDNIEIVEDLSNVLASYSSNTSSEKSEILPSSHTQSNLGNI